MAENQRICSVDACGKKRVASGLCDTHYRRLRRHGHTGETRRPPSERGGECRADGCAKRARTAGYCLGHYERMRRHGDPQGGMHKVTHRQQDEWIRRHVSHAGEDCLIWPFRRTPAGYARYTRGRTGTTASREMCRLAHGESPTPMHQAAHSCGKGDKGCVNPQHLRWATPAENNADKAAHGTVLRGEDNPVATLTEVDVRAIRALSGRISQDKIGQMFGVTQGTVHCVMTRKTWGHVDGEDILGIRKGVVE